jgi:Fe-S cluster assembly protein SufB
MNKIDKQKTDTLKNIVNKEYKYGFKTKIQIEEFPNGLNNEIIRLISEKKREPIEILEYRLKAFNYWKTLKTPEWSSLKYSEIDYQKIKYYSVPKENDTNKEGIEKNIVTTFEKLGIELTEKKENTNGKAKVAVDAVFDSISVGTTFKKDLYKSGIIFCSISEAIRKYPKLVKKFLGHVVPIGDNYFAALNAAVFSDGSFCYIPKNIRSPLELSTYFRINNIEAGQFERTLLIAEENSYISYLEGCTAPQYDTKQLHAAIVELICFEKAEIRYSTVQNWYAGDKQGRGGIYNFVTKRGLCIGKDSKISWTQVETGSALTWKYPSCILKGKNSIGEFYSVALTNNLQQADTGTKMIHLGENTKSSIISKGISSGDSTNTYRGLVKVLSKAKQAKNYSQCDSLLIGSNSRANTIPYMDIQNSTANIEHEASTSKIGEEQIFYFLQRGIKIEKAVELIINGFCKDVFGKLPLEFASEANRLLNLKLEGTVG